MRHVARMEDYRNSQNNFVQKPERKEQFEKNRRIDGMIILERIAEKKIGKRLRSGFMCLSTQTSDARFF